MGDEVRIFSHHQQYSDTENCEEEGRGGGVKIYGRVEGIHKKSVQHCILNSLEQERYRDDDSGTHNRNIGPAMSSGFGPACPAGSEIQHENVEGYEELGNPRLLLLNYQWKDGDRTNQDRGDSHKIGTSGPNMRLASFAQEHGRKADGKGDRAGSDMNGHPRCHSVWVFHVASR
jgi:hypothetical protein